MEPSWALLAQPRPAEQEGRGHQALSAEDSEMTMVSETVASAVRAVDGMRDVLSELNESIGKIQRSRSFEYRLGRLFLEAQDFLDHMRAEATQWADRVVENAKAEAAEIVRIARDEAAQIVDEARRSTVSAAAVQSIQATIDTFNRANADLARELARLNEALSQPPQPKVPEEEPSQVHVEGDRHAEGHAHSSTSETEPLWAVEPEREAFFGPRVRRWPAAGFLGR